MKTTKEYYDEILSEITVFGLQGDYLDENFKTMALELAELKYKIDIVLDRLEDTEENTKVDIQEKK